MLPLFLFSILSYLRYMAMVAVRGNKHKIWKVETRLSETVGIAVVFLPTDQVTIPYRLYGVGKIYYPPRPSLFFLFRPIRSPTKLLYRNEKQNKRQKQGPKRGHPRRGEATNPRSSTIRILVPTLSTEYSQYSQLPLLRYTSI